MLSESVREADRAWILHRQCSSDGAVQSTEATAASWGPQDWRSGHCRRRKFSQRDIASQRARSEVVRRCFSVYCLRLIHWSNSVRQKYISMTTLDELFDTVNSRDILSLLRDIRFYSCI